MRVLLCLGLAAAFTVGLAGMAAAGSGNIVIDFDGVAGHTATYYGFASTSATSADLSVPIIDSGTAALAISDHDATKDMRFVKDISSIMSSSQGIVIFRGRFLSRSGTDSTFMGNVGYSVGWGAADAGVNVVLRASNKVNWKTANGGGGAFPATYTAAFDTTQYHVYALRYTAAGAWQVWATPGNSWSGNSADWVQIAGVAPPTTPISGWNADDGAATQNAGTKVSGLCFGTWDTQVSDLSDVYVDYVGYSTFSNNQDPWATNPLTWTNPYPTVPEPGSLLALATGLVGAAGLAIRRKRA